MAGKVKSVSTQESDEQNYVRQGSIDDENFLYLKGGIENGCENVTSAIENGCKNITSGIEDGADSITNSVQEGCAYIASYVNNCVTPLNNIYEAIKLLSNGEVEVKKKTVHFQVEGSFASWSGIADSISEQIFDDGEEVSVLSINISANTLGNNVMDSGANSGGGYSNYDLNLNMVCLSYDVEKKILTLIYNVSRGRFNWYYNDASLRLNLEKDFTINEYVNVDVYYIEK